MNLKIISLKNMVPKTSHNFESFKDYDNLCEEALAFYNLIFTCSLISSTVGSVTFGFLEVTVIQRLRINMKLHFCINYESRKR